MVPVSFPRPVGRWWQRPPWRDRLVAGGLFFLGGLIYFAGFASVTSRGDAVPLAWRLGVLVVACAGGLLRARMPPLALMIGVLALAVDIYLGLSVPIVIVLADLIFAATLYGSRLLSRIQIAIAVVIPLVTIVVTLAGTGDWRLALLFAWQVAAVPVIPVWWAMNVRNHRELAAAERHRSEQLATINELDRRGAIAAERARMARDLHDVIASHLSAIAIQSEALLSMADGDPDTVRTVVRSVRENSIQSLSEMRAMIGMLRADGGEDADPATAPARLRDLERLLESARAGGLRVELRSNLQQIEGEALDGVGETLPAAVDLAAYRIVQEALTNAVKHGAGASVAVSLDHAAGQLVIEVTNERPDRVPAGQGDQGGTGLVSMRERAETVGGTLLAGPHAGTWRVRAVLPTKGLPTGG